jgi:beta-lactamase class A
MGAWIEQAKRLIAAADGSIGLLVKNLRTKEILFSLNAETVFPSASVIKVPILMALMREAEAGRIDLGEALAVSQENLVEGGLVHAMTGGLALPWRDHALFMIALSDNASTNHIISRLGFERVNAIIGELGMTYTVLGRKMLDFEARSRGNDNFTCCRDMCILFEHLYENSGKYKEVLHILKKQIHNNLLSGLLDPDAFEFAHKTGSLPHTLLDTGIMYLGDPIFAAFMAKELKKEQDGYRLAHELGLLIYEYTDRTSRL